MTSQSKHNSNLAAQPDSQWMNENRTIHRQICHSYQSETRKNNLLICPQISYITLHRYYHHHHHYYYYHHVHYPPPKIIRKKRQFTEIFEQCGTKSLQKSDSLMWPLVFSFLWRRNSYTALCGYVFISCAL